MSRNNSVHEAKSNNKELIDLLLSYGQPFKMWASNNPTKFSDLTAEDTAHDYLHFFQNFAHSIRVFCKIAAYFHRNWRLRKKDNLVCSCINLKFFGTYCSYKNYSKNYK